MKPPSTWSAEEAVQAQDYLQQDPGASDIASAVKEYQGIAQKRLALQRDTSFKPEKPPAALGLRMLLPDRLGGLNVTHYEPTTEEFRTTATGKYAPDSPEEKMALQDYRDEQWAKAYDSAVAKGHPIRRVAMTQDEFDKAEEAKKPKEGTYERLMYEGKRDDGLVPSLMNGFFPGAANVAKGVLSKVSPDAAQYMDEAEAMRSPGEKLGAGVAGSLLPGSLLGKLGKGIGGALGLAESVLGGIGKGAVTGAGLGVAGNTSQAIGEGIESGIRDKEKKGALSRIEETGARSLLEAPGSALGGAAFGGLAGLGTGYRGGLRNEATEAGRLTRAAEDAGAETSVSQPGGWKPPPTLQTKGLGAFEHPTDIAVNKAKPLVAAGAARAIDETVAPIEAENEKYYEATKGSVAKMTPVTKTLTSLLRRRSYESTEGGALPMMNNKPLVKALHDSADPVIAVNHIAESLEKTGSVLVPLDEAISTGMIERDKAIRIMDPGTANRPTMPPGPADAAASAWEASAGPATRGPIPGIRPNGEHKAAMGHLGDMLSPGIEPPRNAEPPKAVPKDLDSTHYSVVFIPKELDARAADEVIGAVDRAAGISEAEGAGRSDPAFKELPRAARAVRDQFPAVPGITDRYPDVNITGPDGKPMTLTGRSAMTHGQSQKLAALKKLTGAAGIPSDRFDPSDVLVQDKIGKSLFGVGPGIGETNRTKALLDFSRTADRGRTTEAAFDPASNTAAQIAQDGGHTQAILRFLNGERKSVSLAERAGQPHELSDAITGFLQDAQAKGATYDGPVYRGSNEADLKHLLRTGQNANSWSVSKGTDGALHFAKKGGVLFKISADSGAVPVDGVPGTNTFEEAIIPKGTRWRVTGTTMDGTTKIVSLEPQKPIASSAERAVKDVIASRILRGGPLSPSDRAPVPSAINPVRAAAQLGHSVKYRADPLAGYLGRAMPASGIVGPKAADPVTQALLELDARIKQYGDHP